MSLAKRLSAVQPNKSNFGCRTCAWLDALTPADRQAWDDWLAAGYSQSQLFEIANTDPDNPLAVSLTGFRNHIKHTKAI